MRVVELAGLLQTESDPARQPVILDVREYWEVATASLPDAVHIPMNQIPSRFGEIDPQRTVVCLCHHGVRSLQVARFLAQQGYDDVRNLAGGIDAWSREVDSSVPLY